MQVYISTPALVCTNSPYEQNAFMELFCKKRTTLLSPRSIFVTKLIRDQPTTQTALSFSVEQFPCRSERSDVCILKLIFFFFCNFGLHIFEIEIPLSSFLLFFKTLNVVYWLSEWSLYLMSGPRVWWYLVKQNNPGFSFLFNWKYCAARKSPSCDYLKPQLPVPFEKNNRTEN